MLIFCAIFIKLFSAEISDDLLQKNSQIVFCNKCSTLQEKSDTKLYKNHSCQQNKMKILLCHMKNNLQYSSLNSDYQYFNSISTNDTIAQKNSREEISDIESQNIINDVEAIDKMIEDMNIN